MEPVFLPSIHSEARNSNCPLTASTVIASYPFFSGDCAETKVTGNTKTNNKTNVVNLFIVFDLINNCFHSIEYKDINVFQNILCKQIPDVKVC